MCGRFTMRATRKALADAFAIEQLPDELRPRYNVAPTQSVPVVRLDPATGARSLVMLRWGLVPSWATDLSIGNGLINARAETVAEKPAFRTAFKRRRCLVVADGFYEWQAVPGAKAKVPHLFTLKDGSPFGFAGIWERWEKGPEPVETVALITTEANGVVAPVHDRMPVILMPEHYSRWLDPDEQRPAALAPLLAPMPDAWMDAHPVGKLVSNPKNDGPECVEPAG